MATRSMIYKEQQDGTLKGIYCHWDGCLEYNGSILLEHYSDPEKLEKLLALGDISSLGEELETSEAVRLYGNCYYISEDFKALSDEEQERLKNEASSGNILSLTTEILGKGSILMILSRKRNKRKGNTSLKKLTMFISKIKVGYGTSTDEMEKSVSMELLLKR